ncbi:uncharacterized protein LOC114013062 [Falco peregrinus]|uniref:uncharacterized protein LOC114013062 n=1 Tax=Falco peregrinus TaxID=8954 RepID=UPI00247A28BF|nr:uncharacterized protein LOC114013062 [Falco peregrinus]
MRWEGGGRGEGGGAAPVRSYRRAGRSRGQRRAPAARPCTGSHGERPPAPGHPPAPPPPAAAASSGPRAPPPPWTPPCSTANPRAPPSLPHGQPLPTDTHPFHRPSSVTSIPCPHGTPSPRTPPIPAPRTPSSLPHDLPHRCPTDTPHPAPRHPHPCPTDTPSTFPCHPPTSPQDSSTPTPARITHPLQGAPSLSPPFPLCPLSTITPPPNSPCALQHPLSPPPSPPPRSLLKPQSTLQRVQPRGVGAGGVQGPCPHPPHPPPDPAWKVRSDLGSGLGPGEEPGEPFPAFPSTPFVSGPVFLTLVIDLLRGEARAVRRYF